MPSPLSTLSYWGICFWHQDVMSSCSSRALTILSTVFGACGLLLVGVAVSTDYWLLMEEGIVLGSRTRAWRSKWPCTLDSGESAL
ncbi:hypothetical protein DPEC_G00143350 [Dallia pectoralis]|uniref:Uncharacterized protein n=1 Tax=Dallia pectoralis TaxID=75939 RepID=A0ACC2GNW1_DALPE|nr:hypothetical protein DPEC_G00143350 [Dallia pectoralis]